MKMVPRFPAFVAITGILMFFSPRLNAGVYGVVFGEAYGPAFLPQSVTILPGDTVVWYNYGSVSSGTSLSVASDAANDPDGFFVVMYNFGGNNSHTFYTSGTHPYTGVHSAYSGQSYSGTVIVKSPVPLTDSKLTEGKFIFTATGLTAGNTNVLQCSTNLTIRTWTTIATNVASGTSMSFTNLPSASSSFYRVIEVP